MWIEVLGSTLSPCKVCNRSAFFMWWEVRFHAGLEGRGWMLRSKDAGELTGCTISAFLMMQFLCTFFLPTFKSSNSNLAHSHLKKMLHSSLQRNSSFQPVRCCWGATFVQQFTVVSRYLLMDIATDKLSTLQPIRIITMKLLYIV